MNNFWYWRNGTPATTVDSANPKWIEQMRKVGEKFRDPKYKIVKQETLPNGYWVSTVWLGLNHLFGDGPPLIFETMVFPKKGQWKELDIDRYSTEQEAMEGHKRMVKKWKKKKRK